MKKTLTERVTILETIIPTLCDDINDIKTNHLVHIQDDIKAISNCMVHMKKSGVEVKTDVAWLKRFFWIIATTSIGGLVTQVLSLLFK